MYKIQTGDTWQTVSKKIFGTDKYSVDIIRANPDVTELLTGKTLIIPEVSRRADSKVSSAKGYVVTINGQVFKYIERHVLTRSVDTIHTLTIDIPFESERHEFRHVLTPFSYRKITLDHDGIRLFTGTVISVIPSVSEGKKSIKLDCYSLPGVLNDCPPSAKSMPLEFNNQTLKEITTTLIKPFGLRLVMPTDTDVFKTVECVPTDNVLQFVIKLARQKGMLVTSTNFGELQIKKPNIGKKAAMSLRQGDEGLESVVPNFKPQGYYSHITGLVPTGLTGDSDTFTIKNPLLTGVFRPFTFIVNDEEAKRLESVVRAKLGRMLSESVSYSVVLPTVYNSENKRISEDQEIVLHYHDAMIYNDYKFYIKSITQTHEAGSDKSVLNCVIPEAYTDGNPKGSIW